MYIEDLSSYTYHRCNGLPGVLPIGWLSTQYPLPTGLVSRPHLDKLKHLAVFKSINFMRGVHRCEFCGSNDLAAEVGPVVRSLGSAEIWLPGQGIIYAAPNLVVHYIEAHSYLPPQQYLDAVEALDVDAWLPPQDYVWRMRT